MRRGWLLLAALAASLAGCSQLRDVLPAPPPKGQVLTVGMLGLPRTVLSTVGLTPQEAEVAANLARPLWDHDERWQLVGPASRCAPTAS